MSYGRKHQQGKDGELWRAIVTVGARTWDYATRTYIDGGEDEEVVVGPYTTRAAALSAGAQRYGWGHRFKGIRAEKLTLAEWTPVGRGGNVDITPERYRELLAAEERLRALDL